ncbi:hypothetical protein B0H16DRAFT_1894330 [Mycena metata]|uniref:Uncharacterized protein n=1 Tax=Mycena metata TaxID=1033252 RepID=A0AAD7HT20_9AGAR|nr:hypothetical protein B0H16DRAFT_1894330 [Mycena metata]
MSDIDEDGDALHLQAIDHNASRNDLLEALKASQLSVVKLLAENRALRKTNDDLLATSSKKRRKGGEEDALGYKPQVVKWAKGFLLTRALFVNTTAFRKNVPAPDNRFATTQTYTDGITVDLYRHIPEKYHSLLDASAYSGLAKDFIREHSDGCSVFISAVRKALPIILKDYDLDADTIASLTSASGNRKDAKLLDHLLRFPNERKATLYAPVLFPGRTQNMNSVFTGPAVMQVHRMMYFGPGCLAKESKPAANSNGVKLGLVEVTEASISTSAIALRFVLSPDKEWAAKGAISNIEWEEEYRTYHKMLASNRNLPHVKKIFKTIHAFVFEGQQISSSGPAADASSDHEMEDTIADALRRFELGTDENEEDDMVGVGAAASVFEDGPADVATVAADVAPVAADVAPVAVDVAPIANIAEPNVLENVAPAPRCGNRRTGRVNAKKT